VVPFAHFFENFVKDADPNFSAGQPLAYYLLNLFIDSPDFMYSTMLGKLPFPHLYTMFIGWIPVSLAVLCLALARTEDCRPLLFLAASAGLAIFVGSTLPLRWFQPLIPSLSALRYAPLIGGLAIPPIVGLATFTVDKLIKPNWPKLVLSTDKKTVLGGFLSMWVLLMALLISLQTGFDFSQLWLYTVRLDNNILVLLENLKPPDLQWVEPPFGEHWYIEPAVAMGLKLSPGIMTWRWKDREWPMPVLEANRGGPPPDMTEKTTADDIPIYGALAGQEYAAVVHADGSRTVCTAHGIGGDIDVTCELAQPGTLIVRENSWDGWQAQMNGRQLILKPGQWLSVDLPSGEQTIEFRYRPWDVPLGILLCVAGVVLVVYCVFKKDSAVDI
jgi:hypothetical protein